MRFKEYNLCVMMYAAYDTLTRTKRQGYHARNLAMSLLVVMLAAP